ncbi:hypothetical protein COL922a_013769 [Colletotrichum nupharicola]|nr:hypothetical protein COL922a_013769 [Colletotrichum nupharicola]
MSALNMVGSILMFPESIMNMRVRGEPPLFSAPDPSCGDEAPISQRGLSGWLSMAMAPYRMLAVPAVVLTVLLFGVSISTNIATSILVSLIFSKPPMLWSTDLVELFNLFVLGGLCAGILIGGLLSDKMIASYTRRKGYHKPESALPLLLPLGIVIPLSTVLTGYGLANGWH